jgi:hypothetical protein
MRTSRFLLLAMVTSGLASVGQNGSVWTGTPFSATAAPAAAPPAISFRKEGACQVPVLNRSMPFKGGATTGEEVTVKLDTARHQYEIHIDASKTPGRHGMRRKGTLMLDHSDCSYRLSGETAARLEVNKDGILFGGVDPGVPGQETPALIVAFKNTSRDLVDLRGNWWVFGSRNSSDVAMATQSVIAYEARIFPDGYFSRCELKSAGGQCNARIGRIFFNGSVFVSQENNGTSGTLIVGQVPGKRVPILLQQGPDGSGMRFFAQHKLNPPP